MVFLDISATPEGRTTHLETVRRVRAQLSIPLTTGGGVSSAEHARALLEAGADKVSVNTAAVARPELITEIATTFGSQCAILALDAARRLSPAENGADQSDWEVVVRSGAVRTGIDAVGWATQAVDMGAGEILLTSWDRDGTRSGYDLPLLSAISAAVNVPIIASGGADSPEHMVEALHAGADAVLAASIFHDGNYTVQQLKEVLAQHGIEVRR